MRALRPSFVHLPAGPWATVYDYLCARFPAIAAEVWAQRMAQGLVSDAQGQPLRIDHAFREGLRVQYFREVADEAEIPFREQILYQDEHLLVVDKPHFLPVQPAGSYVQQTLLMRLIARTGNQHLAPLHRIDRLTAGLVLFSTQPQTRGLYQALFRNRQIDKGYQAIAGALQGYEFPLSRQTRLVDGEPFMRMQEVPGAANTHTQIELLERRGERWLYGLKPITGKRHQLRVHLAALGAGIENDPLYPQLWPRAQRDQDDYQKPLKLLAKTLEFIDPLTGQPRRFTSQLSLEW